MGDLEAVWTGLSLPVQGLSAKSHPEGPGVWLALDPQGRRHLLVRVHGAEVDERLISTRGLHATTATLSVEKEPPDTWADIACHDALLNGTFVTVADDLAREVGADPGQPLEAVRRTLRTWRWFWGVDPDALSVESALGLFGELWFLDRWAPFPEAVECWFGPAGQRHDFVAAAVSVEVKATRVSADGPGRHRISSLDQLEDPETGQLLVFAVQLQSDPNAQNTLSGLVSRVRQRIARRVDLLGLFDQRLSQAKWTPAAGASDAHRYRVVAEELYRVDETFPRLTRSSMAGLLPTGVDDVTYTLDLAACEAWRIAVRPDDGSTFLAGLRP